MLIVKKILKWKPKTKINCSKSQIQALKGFKNNKEILAIKADESKATDSAYKEIDYVQKMQEELSHCMKCLAKIQ